MNIPQLIGTAIIIIGMVFSAVGVLGLIRFNRFYEKALVASKIDTVGTVTIVIGFIIRSGLNLFSLRLLLLLGIIFLLGPLCTHIVARSAYMSNPEETGTPS